MFCRTEAEGNHDPVRRLEDESDLCQIIVHLRLSSLELVSSMLFQWTTLRQGCSRERASTTRLSPSSEKYDWVAVIVTITWSTAVVRRVALNIHQYSFAQNKSLVSIRGTRDVMVACRMARRRIALPGSELQAERFEDKVHLLLQSTRVPQRQ